MANITRHWSELQQVMNCKKNITQDLVFIVKLQFGKTLVSVEDKFALQKDFWFRNFWTKNKFMSKEKFLLQKILGPEN